MLKIKIFPCNMFAENTYVVSDDTNECMIIDCGAYSQDEQQSIETYIREKGLKPVLSILTHAHADHIFGVRYIYDRYNLAPIVCEKDVELYSQFKMQTKSFIGTEPNYDMPPIGQTVKDKDTVSFGNHTFKVIETPGHTRGSVFYYCEDEKIAFSGDTLFRGSIGRTDLPGGSMFQIIQSLRMMTQYPDDVKVYSGHGMPTTIGYELASNPYLDR